VNDAELNISQGNLQIALADYESAFKLMEKPFGKDVFNAALVCKISKNRSKLLEYLKILVNNTDDFEKLKNTFIDSSMNPSIWKDLISKRHVDYDEKLRDQFQQINDRDQLFRPLYETYDDTINTIRKTNFEEILNVTEKSGFPSHLELGYNSSLRGQKHHIVLYHTSQRRSYDKTVMDLLPLLQNAVFEGRLDPELAIFWLNFQNDADKGPFEVYATTQFRQNRLPDSLSEKLWLPILEESYRIQANTVRKEWMASTLEDIRTKAAFLEKTKQAFIFTSVRKSIFALSEDLDQDEVFEQYQLFTAKMQEN
jgi:hypothetical protein